MPKTTTCKCGCNQKFISSHGRKYATPKCRAAVARRKKRVKPKRFCINCKKLIPQKQMLRRPVCFDCMAWWTEEEAPRRQMERNRVWAKTKRKKPKGNTHKVKAPEVASCKNEWNHKMYLAEQKEAKKPNGRGLCTVCHKVELVGDEKFRCPACLHRADDYCNEAGVSGMTRHFRPNEG